MSGAESGGGVWGVSGIGGGDGVDGMGCGGRTGGGVIVDGRGIVARSSRIVLRSGGVEARVKCRRNWRLRRDSLPEPSIRTRYWWNCFTSTTTPVRSHFFG